MNLSWEGGICVDRLDLDDGLGYRPSIIPGTGCSPAVLASCGRCTKCRLIVSRFWRLATHQLGSIFERKDEERVRQDIFEDDAGRGTFDDLTDSPLSRVDLRRGTVGCGH